MKISQTKKKKQATDFLSIFLIAVYLLILSMVVFNSGTLSLWGFWVQATQKTLPLPPLQTPVQKRKRKSIFVFWKILILLHLLLLFSLIYFNIISFVICNYFMSIYIFFFALLLLLYYYFDGCITCIYVSCPWGTPLLSWARSTLKGVVWRFGLWQTKQEQKHWVTKSHLEVFLNVVFMIHFHIVAIVMDFFVVIIVFFYFLMWHTISSCKCKTLSP